MFAKEAQKQRKVKNYWLLLIGIYWSKPLMRTKLLQESKNWFQMKNWNSTEHYFTKHSDDPSFSKGINKKLSKNSLKQFILNVRNTDLSRFKFALIIFIWGKFLSLKIKSKKQKHSFKRSLKFGRNTFCKRFFLRKNMRRRKNFIMKRQKSISNKYYFTLNVKKDHKM